MTGRANIVPSVTLTSTSGNKANINIFNVFVGKVGLSPSDWQPLGLNHAQPQAPPFQAEHGPSRVNRLAALPPCRSALTC